MQGGESMVKLKPVVNCYNKKYFKRLLFG